MLWALQPHRHSVRHPSCLPCCPTEQHPKTNIPSQPTYFFDSLNIEKKPTINKCFIKANPFPHSAQCGDSLGCWWGEGLSQSSGWRAKEETRSPTVPRGASIRKTERVGWGPGSLGS